MKFVIILLKLNLMPNLFFLGQTIVNSSKKFLCQTSQNTSINDSICAKLTLDNELNTMHSIPKVLSSMSTVSNEEFGLTVQLHG